MSITENIHARRSRSFDEHYSKLTGAQVSTIYALTKMGYTLNFVRIIKSELPYAVLGSHNGIVGVDSLGKVDFDPVINVRE